MVSHLPEVRIADYKLTIHPYTADEVVDIIDDAQGQDSPLWISNYNLHALYLHLTDSRFRAACSRASVYLADGWPILQWARLASRQKFSGDRRVGSTDWLAAILSSGNCYSIVAIGGTPDSARLAAEEVQRLYPHVEWKGYDGYDLQPQDQGSLGTSWQEAVKRADIVLVGRGMPTQEYWIAENLDRPEFAGKVVANVGGCIDYIAGKQDLAPRWMGAWGIEWVYRLAKSPRRLAFRYLVEPMLLAVALVQWRMNGDNSRGAAKDEL